MWFDQGPMVEQAAAGARVLVNLNASPYSRGRRLERLAVLPERVGETGCAIVYVNQVGGQDELVFDGASMVIGRDGALVAAAPQFEEEVLFCDLDFEDESDAAAGAGLAGNRDAWSAGNRARSSATPRGRTRWRRRSARRLG